MSARAAVHSLLETDEEMAVLGLEAVYAANTVDSPSEDLFVIIRWETSDVRVWEGRSKDRCTIWVHDKQRDYGRIDQLLKRIKTLMLEATHRPGADDVTMTVADWNQDGPDLVDEGYGTITRWSDFTVVSR